MTTIFKKFAKKSLSLVLALTVILCSVTVSLSAFAEEMWTATFVLDAATNGGTVDGADTKTVEAFVGEVYTPSVTVVAPEGLEFIGWSTDKDAFVGELEFIPKDGATYYAIYGFVVYVGDTVTDATADKGTKKNPYAAFKNGTVPASIFTATTATNCVVVLDGEVELNSISGYVANAAAATISKRLYITGKDPTTGILNETSVTVGLFALGISGDNDGIFNLGVCLDYLTIKNASTGQIFSRGASTNFRLGKNVEGSSKLYVTGIDGNATVPSLYMDIAAKDLANLQMTTRGQNGTVSGDATLVLSGGNIVNDDYGVSFPVKIVRNLNVIVNDYDGSVLTFNTDKVTSVGGAINYVFNNGTLTKIKTQEDAALKFNWAYDDSTKTGALDTAVPATGGFYYIDSAVGGKVLPTETAGKFKVELDEGYNTVFVNGVRTVLDSNNCITLTATSATTVSPSNSDWVRVTYDYVEEPLSDTISFTLDAGTNGGNISGAATKVVEITAGGSYTSDVTVTAPDGLQFIGWSTDNDDYVGKLTFTPKESATYYAIYGEIIYVDGSGTTKSGGADGTKEKPFIGLGHEYMSNTSPFKTTAKNCVVVLNGAVTIKSISNWAVNADKCLYITGLDPTTGVQNNTSVTLSTFALGQNGKIAVFDKGTYIDNCTITSVSGDPTVYLRDGGKNFCFGTNVENTSSGNLTIHGVEYAIESVYIESGISKACYISTTNFNNPNKVIDGDATIVVNRGYLDRGIGGISLTGTIGGNATVVINGYTVGKELVVNTAKLNSVGGAVNYIFNNNMRTQIASTRLVINCDNNFAADTISTVGGFYYIDSGIGGKILPTSTAGKFKVEFDENYNYINVNGVKTQLDNDNCFTLTASDASVVTPTEDDWYEITYGYEVIIPEQPEDPDDPEDPIDPTPSTTISFTLDAATNGGTVDGGKTKTVEVTGGNAFTSNVAVTPPNGLMFIGWSLDKDDFVGELTFTPKNGATYYAIFGHVIYVDAANGKTPAEGGDGSKTNPYKSFSSSGVPISVFQNTTAVNCVVVLKGAVALTSFSAYQNTASFNKRLYLTGLDPTTGVLNTTNVTLHDFATSLSNQSTPVFKRGLYLDYITVAEPTASTGTNGKLYVRGNIANLYLGPNVEGNGKLYVGGADTSTTSAYVETSAKNLLYIDVMNQKSGITFSGNSTVVINGGNITHNDTGVQLGGIVTGNSSVVVNDYDGTVLSVNTAKVQSVGGAINYIFNYGTRAKINTLKLNWSFVDSVSSVDTAVPTTGGFYYIDSAEGGRVLPTDVAGKFKVEFDSGNNQIKVNGTNVELDSDNCFTLTSTSASTVTPSESDWVKITYYYEKVTFKITANAKGQLPNEIAGQPVTWTATANENFVVNDKNQIVGLKTGTGKVYGVSVVNGVAVDTEIDVSVLDYDASKNNFANNNFKVTPTSTKNLYILTVTGGVLNPSTFKISGKFQLLDEVEVEGGIPSGREYKFYCEDIFALAVEGSFITDENTLKTSIFNLGASVEADGSTDGHKIKFIFRTTAITPAGTTVEEGGKLPEKIVVNGSTVTPTNVGAFMIPEALLSDVNTKPTLKDGFNVDSSRVSVNNSTYSAANAKVTYLEDLTYDYADFYATLTQIEEEMRYVRIVCVPYITYTKADGSVGVIYGDSIIRSHDTANSEIHKTEEEVAAELRAQTEQRINEIKGTTSNIAPTGTGTKVYISSSTGDDSNSGTTSSSPIRTISELNSLSLPQGSVVYFKRGDVFRGQVICQAGVTYTAYGDGAKPEIYASLKNYAESGTWTQVATNIYKYSEAQNVDVGMIVFNAGKAHGIKAVNKSGVNTTTGKSFSGYTSLDTHLHFYQDEDGYVYLYFMGGNPADVYDSIEFSLTKAIFKVSTSYSNVTIDNLVFRYTGSHGISGTTCNNLTVQNCEFYWIGGGLSSDGYTRFGNGVEIWGGAENYTVRNCYFHQIYDAGATIQYDNRTDTAKNMVMKNIRFENNVMEYCNYSIEYFLTSAAGGSIEDLYITGNHMWYSGYGLCSQRPDRDRGCHIMSWLGHENPITGDYFITNNLFVISELNLLETTSIYTTSVNPQYSGNTFIQFTGRNLGRTGYATTSINSAYDSFDNNVRKTIWDKYGDTTATVIWVEEN